MSPSAEHLLLEDYKGQKVIIHAFEKQQKKKQKSLKNVLVNWEKSKGAPFDKDCPQSVNAVINCMCAQAVALEALSPPRGTAIGEHGGTAVPPQLKLYPLQFLSQC